MFFKKLFYDITNLFNKNKLKGRNIGGDFLIYHPDGVHKVDLGTGYLYRLTVSPEVKIEKIE